MADEITYLRVPRDAESHAERFGAQWDARNRTWFVIGLVHSELQNYIPRTANQPFQEQAPPCPVCGAPTRKSVSRKGQPYWSCLKRFKSGCPGVIDYLDYLDAMAAPTSVSDFLPKVAGSLFAPANLPAVSKESPPETLKVRWTQIILEAANTLGSDRQAVLWLTSPKAALGKKTPVEALVTDGGCDEVLRLLRSVWK